MTVGAIDVHYRDEETAVVALVIASDWRDEDQPIDRMILVSGLKAEAYEPGSFYKKELPYLLRVLEGAPKLDAIIIDGYVWLAPDRPGLGKHLYDALGGTTPIIGIAKTHFEGSDDVAESVLRGMSGTPLYVTAEGIDLETAAENVRFMTGPFRLPMIVSRANSISRTAFKV